MPLPPERLPRRPGARRRAASAGWPAVLGARCGVTLLPRASGTSPVGAPEETPPRASAASDTAPAAA
ncbi:hypothetical protein [Streptomyces sp. TverLS-915]|uniref:hypothetical protein n=1 Tax=Streptomyces sp. TverLS-915 TaxID=1839763 RepID=UPI0015B4CB71|nr:hypothetical protein [Streptomyces sp. TverLS-915]